MNFKDNLRENVKKMAWTDLNSVLVLNLMIHLGSFLVFGFAVERILGYYFTNRIDDLSKRSEMTA
jgi:predicted Na+-dependent transporter